jgi:hypothetical protein
MTANQSFPKNVRDLRIVQVVCILLALSGALLIHMGKAGNRGAVTPVHWFVALAAVYCAVSGFTFQRKMTQGTSRPQQMMKEPTPFSRWRVGHLMRLATATAVSLWGAVLSVYGALSWLAYALSGLGFLLLLIWTPGRIPIPTQPHIQRKLSSGALPQ